MNNQLTDDASDVVTVPPELVDLIRFMAAHYMDVLKFIHGECPEKFANEVPGLQGVHNIFCAQKIAEQEYYAKNLRSAIDWLIANPDFGKV
jgi:hypothetical protein